MTPHPPNLEACSGAEIAFTAYETDVFKSSSVNVESEGTIYDAWVLVESNYYDPSQLEIFLRSPVGTEIRLWNRNGEPGTPLHGVFDPDLQPAEGPGALDRLNGEQARGTWTLRAVDRVPGQGGKITRWCLRLYATDALPPLPGDMDNNRLMDFNDLFLFSRGWSQGASIDNSTADILRDNSIDEQDLFELLKCLGQ